MVSAMRDPDLLHLGVPERVQKLVRVLGSRREAAHHLDVDKSTVGRWESGRNLPRGEVHRRVVDLDYVITRLAEIWPSGVVIHDWLTSPNGFLDGAVPINVVLDEGPERVVEAIDAELAGSFA